MKTATADYCDAIEHLLDGTTLVIDVTNESLNKFIIYAALGVSEIWRYDGKTVRFYQLATGEYGEVSRSRAFPRLTPERLATVLEQSRAVGQTATLAAFRQQWSE